MRRRDISGCPIPLQNEVGSKLNMLETAAESFKTLPDKVVESIEARKKKPTVIL
jgi:hypothetical protein